MILKIACSDTKLVDEILENYPNLPLEVYNENTTQGKKDAFAFKGTWAARENPFAMLFTDEGKVVKAFYSEVKECTFDNINNYLISYE